MTARGTAVLTGLLGQATLMYGASSMLISGVPSTLINNMAVTPRIRKIAVRVEVPDGTWTDGTAVTTALTQFAQTFALPTSGAASQFMFVQPALGGSSSTSNGEGHAFFQAWTNSTAQIVARQTVQIEPDINATQVDFIPLGKPFAALGATGVMAAISARGCVGSPAINFAMRTFTGDPTIASTWGASLLGVDKTFSSTTEDYNSGDMAISPGTVGWAQIGLKVPSGSYYGTLDIILAVKY